MSVLIKGIKRPKDCDTCKLSDIIDCKLWKIMDVGEIHPECPLTELPEKHGRLIDADELWNKMSIYTDNEGAKFPFGDDDSIIHRDSACFMIECADPIIEAEDEG